MSDYKLGEIETRFAELIWEREPLTSGELVKLAQENLNWKKSNWEFLKLKETVITLLEQRDPQDQAIW